MEKKVSSITLRPTLKMNYLPGILTVAEFVVTNVFSKRPTRETIREVVQDPQLLAQIAEFQRQNEMLMEKYQSLIKKMENDSIDSFEDLERFDKKSADALVKLALETKPIPMIGRNFGFFGLTSSGKSTIINSLVGQPVAEVGSHETTKQIKAYPTGRCTLYDLPGRNDDLSYFTMEYIAFWKGLTNRFVLITSTVKEMTKVFHLLDALHLQYDIIVNKFDLVKPEERNQLEQQIRREINECQLKNVRQIWFFSAQEKNLFPDWKRFQQYLEQT